MTLTMSANTNILLNSSRVRISTRTSLVVIASALRRNAAVSSSGDWRDVCAAAVGKIMGFKFCKGEVPCARLEYNSTLCEQRHAIGQRQPAGKVLRNHQRRAAFTDQAGQLLGCLGVKTVVGLVQQQHRPV